MPIYNIEMLNGDIIADWVLKTQQLSFEKEGWLEIWHKSNNTLKSDTQIWWQRSGVKLFKFYFSQ